MAYEIGTASNFKDLFDKMVSFLTTNASLVSAGQAWEIQRQYKDNIAQFTTSFQATNTDAVRNPQHTLRYDPRSINYDAWNGTNGWYAWSLAGAGNSGNHMTFKLRTAKAVDRTWIRHAYNTSGYGPKAFTIEYSDDGVAWTQFASINDTGATPTSGEERTFTGLNSAGAHLWYRIKLNDVFTATKYAHWSGWLLLNGTEPINHWGDEVIWKAKGNSGAEAIYTGVRSEYDSAAGWYNWMLNGYTGYDSSIQSWFKQPGAISTLEATPNAVVPMMTYWDAAMSYWFVANGRSFRWTVKVGTSYFSGYLGFLLPYCTPSQYPYPLAVSGNLAARTTARATNWRYSIVDYTMGTPHGPGSTAYANGGTFAGSASMLVRDPSGVWQCFLNRTAYGSGSTEGSAYFNYSESALNTPPTTQSAIRAVWPHIWFANSLRDGISGGQILLPCVLLQSHPVNLVYGELDGYFATSGTNNGAENTSVVGGKNHVVFSGCYRTAQGEFYTMCLDT